LLDDIFSLYVSSRVESSVAQCFVVMLLWSLVHIVNTGPWIMYEITLPFEMRHHGLECHKPIMKKYGLGHSNFLFHSPTSCMVWTVTQSKHCWKYSQNENIRLWCSCWPTHIVFHQSFSTLQAEMKVFITTDLDTKKIHSSSLQKLHWFFPHFKE
jgi:hypothetical protein